MTFATICILALGLSMDAVAVAVTNGICYRGYTPAQMLLTAAFFGAFQGIMPLTGFLLGSTISGLIQQMDFLITFGVLGYLGCGMLWKGIAQLRHPQALSADTFSVGQIALQAVATSLDALAVGVSLAALHQDIWGAAALIALITFVLSLLGCALGKSAGHLIGSKAQLFGGSLLLLIALKVLLEHPLRP